MPDPCIPDTAAIPAPRPLVDALEAACNLARTMCLHLSTPETVPPARGRGVRVRVPRFLYVGQGGDA